MLSHRDNFSSSFLTIMTFTSLFFFIALDRHSSIMLNRKGESRHSCLVPNLWGKHSVFIPDSMMLAVGFSLLSFVKLKKFPSLPGLLRMFVIEVLNFVKSFFCNYCTDYMTLLPLPMWQIIDF